MAMFLAIPGRQVFFRLRPHSLSQRPLNARSRARHRSYNCGLLAGDSYEDPPVFDDSGFLWEGRFAVRLNSPQEKLSFGTSAGSDAQVRTTDPFKVTNHEQVPWTTATLTDCYRFVSGVRRCG